MDKLAAEFKALAVTSFGDTAQGAIALAKRPDNGGTAGRKIEVRANLFRLKVRSKDYKGTSTAGPNRQTSNDVWDALVAANPDGLGPALAQAAFDCRQNAFTFGRLNLDNAASKTYRVSLPTETETRPSREFDVKLSLAQTLDLKVLEAFCQNKRAPNLQDLAATAIMALDVLLRHSLFRRPELVVGGGGRKFLDARQATPLGEGAQVLAGLFQSVRPTMSGMVVNLDSAYSPYLVTGKLLQVCNMILGREQQGGGGYGAGGRGGGRGGRAGPGARGGRGGGRGGLGGAPGGGGPAVQTPFSPAELLHLKKMLRRAKVRVTHRVDRRPFAIIGFGQPAGKQTIKIADRSGEGNGDKKKGKDAGGAGKKGKAKPTAAEAALAAARGELMSFEKAKAPEKTTTVYEYFTATYPNFKTNPALQCVELRGGQLVPIECLELLQGTAIPPTRLSGNQAATMINVAAKPPAERLQAIQAIRQHQADLGPQSRAAKWGIEVDRELLQLEGRLLAPPRVQYSPSSKVAAPNVRFGAWNLVESKFLVPAAPLTRWAVVVFAPPQFTPRNVVEGFFKETLLKQAQLRGMTIRMPAKGIRIEYWDGRSDKLEPLRKASEGIVMQNPENPQRLPPQMLFCILQDPKTYDDIKRKAAFDLPVSVPTQVMLAKKAFNPKGVDQYAGNAKLSGINSTVVDMAGVPRFAAGKTMLLGADVTHPTGFGTPAAGEEVAPSIAAVVGSSEPTNMRYAAQVREQTGRKEFITDLAGMAETLIRGFIKANRNNKPETIVMFRDGVSEGQWAPVVHSEVSALKAAFRAIDQAWSPKLTYIVCMKRHNVRFFSSDPKNTDRTGNLVPGVVVDRHVTHPYVFDFFLQAHAGLKGTARPTRYVVLLDENKYSSDELQKMTNSLSFSFARATRSTSLIPPAYYADIVATKARSFVSMDDASTSGGLAQAKGRGPLFIQEKLDREVAQQKMGSTMWFI
ncbi:Protein argonaute [Rhodotorula sphaerocarpa]